MLVNKYLYCIRRFYILLCSSLNLLEFLFLFTLNPLVLPIVRQVLLEKVNFCRCLEEMSFLDFVFRQSDCFVPPFHGLSRDIMGGTKRDANLINIIF